MDQSILNVLGLLLNCVTPITMSKSQVRYFVHTHTHTNTHVYYLPFTIPRFSRSIHHLITYYFLLSYLQSFSLTKFSSQRKTNSISLDSSVCVAILFTARNSSTSSWSSFNKLPLVPPKSVFSKDWMMDMNITDLRIMDVGSSQIVPRLQRARS